MKMNEKKAARDVLCFANVKETIEYASVESFLLELQRNNYGQEWNGIGKNNAERAESRRSVTKRRAPSHLQSSLLAC